MIVAAIAGFTLVINYIFKVEARFTNVKKKIEDNIKILNTTFN